MANKPRLIECPLECKGLHSSGCGPNCIRTRNEKAFDRYRKQLRHEGIQSLGFEWLRDRREEERQFRKRLGFDK